MLLRTGVDRLLPHLQHLVLWRLLLLELLLVLRNELGIQLPRVWLQHSAHHHPIQPAADSAGTAPLPPRPDHVLHGPERVHRPHHRIASTNQHPIGVGAKHSVTHGACGVEQG